MGALSIRFVTFTSTLVYIVIWNQSCVVSLIYLLSTRVYLCFAVQKLAKFFSNPGTVHFEGLVQLLLYIKGNRNLGLIYYTKIEY